MTWSDPNEALDRLKSKVEPHTQNYLGFYSSYLGGFFKESWAMQMPLDDHGFHRGDGVFEAVRIFDRAYVDLLPHLTRLEASAQAIEMKLPFSISEVRDICLKLARLCDSATGILRLYVTRGPGGFSPNPYESKGAQLYAAITRLQPPKAEIYERGVRTMLSSILSKEERWSRIKSCNYLPNVMMKKECVDRGFDFALSLDAKGRVCEGSTENLMIITKECDLFVPRFDYTLRGTTVRTVMRLAEALQKESKLRKIELRDLSLDDVLNAKEAAFVGTTLGVLPIRSFDEHPIGFGHPGELAPRLNQMLLHAWSTDPALRTSF